MFIAIIIPCFNEANRLPIAAFQSFVEKEKEAQLIFVNDGSNDNTLGVLKSLALSQPRQLK